MSNVVDRRLFLKTASVGVLTLLAPQSAFASKGFTRSQLKNCIERSLGVRDNLGELKRHVCNLQIAEGFEPEWVLDVLCKELSTLKNDTVRKALSKHIKRDFENGRVVSVWGWRISETEAALATIF